VCLDVDRGVIATATELFEARHYPGVVAMCSDALEDEPECIALLAIRARARMALRRDLDAQADLRDLIRLDPGCGMAFRLLGQLAARRDENESAAVFFREALRLDPDDREAHDWLTIVAVPSRPAAVAKQLPANAAAAGHFSSRTRPPGAGQPRLARGTQSPGPDERPTRPFGRVVDPTARTPRARPVAIATPQPQPQSQAGSGGLERPTLPGRPPTQPPARPAPRLAPRTVARGLTPELPGFGEYLVASGILTRERLRAAQAYQRSMKVQLSTAIVTLGLATPQRIEWAAVAHQSQLARERPSS
jgi:tetratricopeptide (TPR) repeat protein